MLEPVLMAMKRQVLVWAPDALGILAPRCAALAAGLAAIRSARGAAAGATAMQQLATNAECRVALGTADAPAALLGLLRLHRTDATVVKPTLGTLRNLAPSTVGWSEAMALGDVLAAFKTVAADEVATGNGLATAAVIMKLAPPKAESWSATVLPTVLGAMAEHHAVADVQCYGCMCLSLIPQGILPSCTATKVTASATDAFAVLSAHGAAQVAAQAAAAALAACETGSCVAGSALEGSVGTVLGALERADEPCSPEFMATCCQVLVAPAAVALQQAAPARMAAALVPRLKEHGSSPHAVLAAFAVLGAVGISYASSVALLDAGFAAVGLRLVRISPLRHNAESSPIP